MPSARARSIAAETRLSRVRRAHTPPPHIARKPKNVPMSGGTSRIGPEGGFERRGPIRIRGLADRRRGRERGVPREALLGEDRERGIRRALHRPLRRAEGRHGLSDDLLQRVAALSKVLAELLERHLEDAAVQVAVTGDLVPRVRDPPDERRALTRDPAEDEERRRRAGSVEEREDALDPDVDPLLASRPGARIRIRAMPADVEPVLHVDGQDRGHARAHLLAIMPRIEKTSARSGTSLADFFLGRVCRACDSRVPASFPRCSWSRVSGPGSWPAFS